MTDAPLPFNHAELAWQAQCRPQIAAAVATGEGDALATLLGKGNNLLAQRYVQTDAWEDIMRVGNDALAQRWWDACPPVFLDQPWAFEADCRATLYGQALTDAARHGRTVWVDRLIEVMAARYRYMADVHHRLEPGEALAMAYRSGLKGACEAKQTALAAHLVQCMPETVRAQILERAWKDEDGELFAVLVEHAPEPLPPSQWKAWGDQFPVRCHDPESPDDDEDCRAYLGLVQACLPHLSADQILRQVHHVQVGVSDMPGLQELLTQACVSPERRAAVREALPWAPAPLPALEAALLAAEREAALTQRAAPARAGIRHRV